MTRLLILLDALTVLILALACAPATTADACQTDAAPVTVRDGAARPEAAHVEASRPEASHDATPLPSTDSAPGIAPEAAAPILDAGPTYRAALMLGQSNMGQNGQFDSIRNTPDAIYQFPVEPSLYSVRAYENPPDVTPTDLFLPSVQPILGNLGLEVSFARTRLLAGVNPAVSKFFVRGSSIGWWLQNRKFHEAVAWFRESLGYWEAQGHRVVVDSIVWLQGESEKVADVPLYEARLAEGMDVLFAEFGRVRVIVVQMPPSVTTGVRDAQASYVANHPPAALVGTTGIPYGPDGLHWRAVPPGICEVGVLAGEAVRADP